MGKTEKGALFLDPSLTSPYDFFQYWRNVRITSYNVCYTKLLRYVVESGVARERVVTLGLFSESGAEVLGGVKRGEVVVVRGQNLIRDGSRVQVAERSL